MTWRVVCCLAGLLVQSCGDPLADATYRGEPLFSVTGVIVGDARAASGATSVGLTWVMPPASALRGVSELVTVAPRFPAAFDLLIYEPPPAVAFADDEALAGFILVDDVDGDGKDVHIADGEVAPPDLIAGMSYRHFLYYSRRGEVTAVPIDSRANVRPGYNLVAAYCPAGGGGLLQDFTVVSASSPVEVLLLDAPLASLPDVSDAAFCELVGPRP